MLRTISLPLLSALVIAGFLFSSCSGDAGASSEPHEPAAFDAMDSQPAFQPTEQWNAYWYNGQAEVSSYTVQQGRYRDSHPGSAVVIFVTEDFSKSKQVKLDDPYNAGKDKVKVMKMNQSLKFNTGLYPYSVMLSTFLPVDRNNYPNALKVTSSIQEWCGMAFMQANREENDLAVKQFSYFESEGDQIFEFPETFTEDELWNVIRLSPDDLPLGELEMIPSFTYLRFSHQPVKPYRAEASLSNKKNGYRYTIYYPELARTFTLHFSKDFPYTIDGWEDTYSGSGGRTVKTFAERDTTIMIDYWNKNSPGDRALRKELGLPEVWQ